MASIGGASSPEDLSRAGSGEDGSTGSIDAAGIDFAWRVHDGLSDWTARVDTKASIALAIEVAAAGFLVNLVTGRSDFIRSSALASVLFSLGSFTLAASVVLSVLVIFPQLRGRKSKLEAPNHFIYFGHLRHWEPAALEERLRGDKVGLTQLATQLVNMSQIVWRKHRWLQWSLAMFVAGVVLISGALLVPRSEPHSDATVSPVPAETSPALPTPSGHVP